MRPITKMTMYALATAAMAASAQAAAVDYFLKLGNIKGESAARSAKGEQIEITSWSWGATQAADRVNKIDAFTIKQSVRTGGVGEARVAAGGIEGTGGAPAAGTESVGGAPAATSDVAAPRDAASGLPTGKRQHKPLAITKPLDRGSVTVKGSLPGCTVGAAYPDAVLQTDVARYEFKEVFITSCAMPSLSGGGGGGGDPVPTESISFNYAKIQLVAVRDPKDAKDKWKAPGPQNN